MKLFTKYNRINLVATIAIFVVSSLIFYFLFMILLIRDVDDNLMIEKREIEVFVAKNSHLPDMPSVNDQRFEFVETEAQNEKTSFRTFLAYDTTEKEDGNFREISFGINVSGKKYNIRVIKSLEATDDLLRSVLWIVIPAILLILTLSLLINRIILKKLWKPFYETLQQVKLFSITKNKPLKLRPAKVEEFTLLNNTLVSATARAREDYLLLKEFTENASHEMQTPLASIRSKLDMLIQDEHLSEAQSVRLQAVYESIQKLSHLNQSLLLLTKIDNQQFAKSEPVKLYQKITQKAEEFAELWDNAKISIELLLEDAVVEMSEPLAEIMLNNLISNATIHNMSGGKIRIHLTRDQLTIFNTSLDPALKKDELFSRYYLKSKNSGQNGLGLSIIRKICDASGFEIRYQYQDNMHAFIINWPPALRLQE